MSGQPANKPAFASNPAIKAYDYPHTNTCASDLAAASPESAHTLDDAALHYASIGWSVFPLVPKTKTPFKDSHGFKDATSDVDVVERWWHEHPDANIGLRTGALSGLIVLDVDPRHGGDLSLADLEAKHGRLPDTVESITGSNGRHIFFQCPDAPIHFGTDALAPGLDIPRYVVLPPSIHPNGQRYEWEASSEPGEADVAPMPEWMVEALSQPAQRTRSTPIRSTTYWGEDVEVVASSKRTDLDLALARLLGIDQPVGRKFLCLLHDEKHPSAWLFWGKGGDLLYRCEHHGGYTLNIPTLRASLRAGHVVRLQGARQHQEHRLLPLLAAGVVQLLQVIYMPLPKDAPKAAKAWYDAFIWTDSFNRLAFPGASGTAFSRRFALRMTGLSEHDEQMAAKWLLRQGYVHATGHYKAYGKTCNLLSLGPGPALGLLDDEVEVLDEAA